MHGLVSGVGIGLGISIRLPRVRSGCLIILPIGLFVLQIGLDKCRYIKIRLFLEC